MVVNPVYLPEYSKQHKKRVKIMYFQIEADIIYLILLFNNKSSKTLLLSLPFNTLPSCCLIL